MWTIKDSMERFGVERWGDDYFSINVKGHLIISPRKDMQYIDIKEVVDEIAKRNIGQPVLLRFPQVLKNKICELIEAFDNSMSEFEYTGGYQPVFPMKVNQLRGVLDEITKIGYEQPIGIEVGTKTELVGALSLDTKQNSLLICNGFKDVEYIKMAMYATMMKKNVVIVIDEIGELPIIIQLSKELGISPVLGMRVKLYSKISGKWSESGGEYAKFGLSTHELLSAIKMLQKNNMADCFKMLHFHTGSQTTEIRRMQKVIKEAARVYTNVCSLGIKIKYLNIGGGIAVDYGGIKTPSNSSRDYTIQEYTNNVVYTLKEVCDEESVDYPLIISESGRVIAAYHSILIFDIIAKRNIRDGEIDEEDSENWHSIVAELYELLSAINEENYIEYYHDAIDYKEDLLVLFNLGQIGLKDKANGELLFFKICKVVIMYTSLDEVPSEELDNLSKVLSNKHIGNFSLFQSMVDSWAIDQLFPIIPIQNLDQMPNARGTIVDLTCDSDGEIKQFVIDDEIKKFMEFHSLSKGHPYYVAVPLVGAYQDTLGNYHNLFGSVNEVYVSITEDGDIELDRVIEGDKICDVLGYMDYGRDEIMDRFASKVSDLVEKDEIKQNEADMISNYYKKILSGYTYFNPDGYAN